MITQHLAHSIAAPARQPGRLRRLFSVADREAFVAGVTGVAAFIAIWCS